MKKIILTTLIAICCSIMLGQTQAVHFSGTNSSIDVGNSFGNGLRTIECWFRPSVNISSSITDPAYSLVVRNDAESNEFGLYIIGSDWTVNKGKLAFYVRYNGSINQIHSNVNTWNANTWYHVSGTIDPVDGMKLYIDGIAQTETKPSFKNATTNQTQVTKIGTWGDANLRYFKGDIDEVRFWNRALTSSEVNSKKCCLLNPANETGLVGYWHFEEGTGTTTNEVINNSNNTLTNVSWVSSNNCISNLTTWYLDQDNDNYASQTTLSCQSPGTGWTTVSMPVIDCNDQNAAIYPSQLENYFNSIDDNCDAIIQYQLSANSNSGGSISPNGNMIVNQSANQAYQITPQNGYYIQDVMVDGVSVGTSSSYFFNSIQAPHTIVAIFAQLVPSVTITSDDNDNIICNGTSITLNATVTNAGSSPVYQWQVNGNNVGSNQSSYTTTNLQNNDVITCEVNPGVNQAASNAITISIAESPIVNVTKNAWNGTCIGNSIWLCGNSGQSSTATYLWSNGTTTDCFNANNAGIYTCTVTNSIGCQASGTVEVIYDPLPDQTINYPNQISLCANKSDSVYLINPSQNQTYQWFTYDVTGTAHIISGETTTKLKIGNGSNINSLGNTTLIVYITNTVTNCYSSNWINVFINPQPNVIITSSNGTSLCNGNNTTLTANGTSSYIWNNGATTQNISVSPQSTTNYNVTGTDANGCTGTANAQITVNTMPNITITSSNGNSFCNGGSTVLTANGGVSYLWDNGSSTQNISVSPQSTTNYNVTGMDANGCTGTSNIQITVNSIPDASLNFYNTVFCSGANTFGTYSNYVLNTGSNENYQWYDNGVVINGETNYGILHGVGSNINSIGTHYLTVTVTNSITNCSSTSNTYTLLVEQTPTPQIIPQGPVTYCGPMSPLQLNVINSANTPNNFTWSTGETTSSIVVATQGLYQVQMNSIPHGCPGYASVIIDEFPAVNANISASGSTNICSNSNVTLSVPNNQNTSYQWYRNNNVIAGATSYSLLVGQGGTINQAGNYSVLVTYILTNCSSTSSTLAVQISSNCPSINSTYCNRTISNIAGQGLVANNIVGATNYEFRFEEVNSSGAIISTTFGTSTSSVITLLNVNNPGVLHYNSHYLTSVRVSTNNGTTWTPFGAKCNLYTLQPPNTPNNGYCGIHRNNLLSIYSVNPMGLATQYKLRFKIVGSSNYLYYTLPAGQNSIVLQNIPGMVYNTTYEVEISSLVPYSYNNQTSTTEYGWSPYGNMCLFYMDHPVNNPNNGYCGIHRTNLNLQYSVNTMGMAQQYKLRFRVNGDNDPSHYIEYTMPMGATATSLINVPGLAYNTVYTVEISSYVPYSYNQNTSAYSYAWSPYGVSCLLYIDQPANNPSNGYCGIQRNLNGQYCASSVGRATQYKFRLMVNGDPTNTYLYSIPFNYNGIGNLCFALNANNIPGLQNNTHYKIEISTFVPYTYDLTDQVYTNSTWSPYGNICDLYVGNPPAGSRMAQQETLSNLDDTKLETINISVFPNPAKNNVNIVLPEDGKANITIYDLQGKIVNELTTEASLTDFSLDNLSEGVYIIHVIQNGKTYKEKIIKN